MHITTTIHQYEWDKPNKVPNEYKCDINGPKIGTNTWNKCRGSVCNKAKQLPYKSEYNIHLGILKKLHVFVSKNSFLKYAYCWLINEVCEWMNIEWFFLWMNEYL